MGEPDSGFVFLEHTADVGIRAWGPSIRHAFQQAGAGLATLMGMTAAGPGHVEQIHVEGTDAGGLLVALLNELVYLLETADGKGLASLRVTRLAPTSLDADAELVPTDASRSDISPPKVTAEVQRLLGPASGATVKDIVTEQRIALSGLTSIDLPGLTKLELAFALLLAAGASGLMLALGLAERRRTFAIASALGARSRQLGGFVWSEAAFVTIGGLAMGALSGWWLAQVIVKILTGVFDPPPERLSVPWTYLATLLLAVAAAVTAAGAGMLHATRRPPMAVLRDL